MAFLDVRDLVVEYADDQRAIRAVDGVSFSLEEGRTLGLIGESGSGKTSMANALMRTLPSNVAHLGGTITLQGMDLFALSDEAFRREIRWKRIAVVFQGAMSAFNPVLKVGFQVAERLLLEEGWERKAAMAQARELLASVGLDERVADRYPHELSGGMKQRAVVAMALALKPELLILDEPTSALDVSVQAQVMNLFKQLKWEHGISMIFITHDIALASDISDTIAVVQGGTINECAPAEEIFERSRDPYTRRLLAVVPRLGDGGAEDSLLGVRPKTSATKGPEKRRTGSAPHLVAKDLRVHFPVRRGLWSRGIVKAVDGVSLSIQPGESLALVGESGSGKTTFARATLGLIRPTAGRVHVGNTDVAALNKRLIPAFRRKAQAIFQDPYASMSPFMRIYDVIEEPLLIHGVGGGAKERRELIHHGLEQVNLTPPHEIAAKFPHSLSGGQRQRVSIARAMVLQPKYVVADEPVSMIDASSRTEILRLLREVQRERGITFLYITHDIAGAQRYADRMAVMYLGTIVEEGEAALLTRQPLHPYTQALLETVPSIDPNNRDRLRPVIPGEPPSAADPPTGCPFVTRCRDAITGTCDRIRPHLQEVTPGRRVACHLYEPEVTVQESRAESESTDNVV